MAISVALLGLPLIPPSLANAAEYEMATVADYVADPTAGTISVSVAVSFTNTLADPPGQVSAFNHVDLAIQDGASMVVARDGAGQLQVGVNTQNGVLVAAVATRARVLYNATVSFTLTYRLADGAAPELHVRPGVVKFPAWGFGTSSQVTVRLPSGYDANAEGDAMQTDEDTANVVLTSDPIPDPGRWLALITAILPRDYVTQSASVPLSSGTVDLQVRAWSDDPAWGEQTLALLVEALPLLEEATRTGRRIRCLCQVGPEFRGLTPSAAWEDVRLGLRALRLFEACAVVSDLGWIRESTRLAAFFMPCPVQVFGEHEREQAIKWLSSMPEQPAIEHRLIAESGVVVVEVSQPLRAPDFEALGLTVDSWLDTHERLQGLVLHARAFHGWENIGGLVRHIRFVRDHHRKIRRVAVVLDGPMGALAPKVAEHFVQAELRHFGYDELDDAIAWAAGSHGRQTASAVEPQAAPSET